MTNKKDIQDFLSQRTLAVVGVSRQKEKFGTMAYNELKAKGYRVFPVNPSADSISGERCYPSLSALPEPVGGVLIVVPSDQTEKVVQDTAQAGIRRVWIQQGADSPAALQICQEQGISAVYGECILMFAEPSAFYHRIHRWIWGLMGKLPK